MPEVLKAVLKVPKEKFLTLPVGVRAHVTGSDIITVVLLGFIL